MAELTRLGIIGIGGFGLFCLDKCRYIPGVKVAGLADINEAELERMGRQFEVPYTTTDWMELVENPEIDVVHIATPPSLHAEQGIAAAKAGKHIFMEKPLAISFEEADELFEAARSTGVRVGIDFVMRYSALYDKVRTIIAEGLLGKPLRALFENNAKDLPAEHWFWDPWLSGAIPVEHGVHFFDIFYSLFGAGKLRWAGRTQRSGNGEDKWLAVFQYLDGMFGTFYHGFDKPEIIEKTWLEIEFEQGRIALYGWIPERLTLDSVVTEQNGKRLEEILGSVQINEIDGALTTLANGHMITVTHRITADILAGPKLEIYGKAVQDAMADFIAWTKDPTHHPRVTGEDGKKALEVALAVNEMARENG